MTYTTDFKVGSVWISSGGGRVTVISSTFTGGNSSFASNWQVEYAWQEQGKVTTHIKDGWNFQVRYRPL